MTLTMHDLRLVAERYLRQIEREKQAIYAIFPDMKPKIRKPMSTEARLNISKGRKAYFKRLKENGKSTK